ncbi:MAG: hypothetical protein KDC44_05105, partial [Phaeodactylibacter sp.]|nr:hypothetical protein [Phaeodactylibacter sp.]
AYINGTYGAWSPAGTFNVEPPNTDCAAETRHYQPSAGAPLQSPTLRAPINKAIMPNGSWDRSQSYHWFFEWQWTDGADYYELEIIDPKGNRIATLQTTATDLRYTLDYPYNQYPEDWQWRVRAYGRGHWSPWSPNATFTLERSATQTCN